MSEMRLPEDDDAAIEIPPLSLGWRLRMSMEKANHSREYMAARCQVSVSTVSRWMHDGGTPPRRGDLQIWAKECRVPQSWLAPEEGETDPNAALSTGQYSNLILTLIQGERDGSPRIGGLRVAA